MLTCHGVMTHGICSKECLGRWEEETEKLNDEFKRRNRMAHKLIKLYEHVFMVNPTPLGQAWNGHRQH